VMFPPPPSPLGVDGSSSVATPPLPLFPPGIDAVHVLPVSLALFFAACRAPTAPAQALLFFLFCHPGRPPPPLDRSLLRHAVSFPFRRQNALSPSRRQSRPFFGRGIFLWVCGARHTAAFLPDIVRNFLTFLYFEPPDPPLPTRWLVLPFEHGTMQKACFSVMSSYRSWDHAATAFFFSRTLLVQQVLAGLASPPPRGGLSPDSVTETLFTGTFRTSVCGELAVPLPAAIVFFPS